MTTIRQIAKPEIQLSGATIDSTGQENEGFIATVDHSKEIVANSEGITIGGKTLLDKTNLLTFYNSVRVIITNQVSPSASFVQGTRSLKSFEFEGKTVYPDAKRIEEYAETYYTLNGKEPTRNKSYLYTYGSLGFVIDNGPTGNDVITLKVKTYLKGQISATTSAYFKIIRSRDSGYIGVPGSDM